MNENIGHYILNAPLSPKLFGLPPGFKVRREELPELHAVAHHVGIDQGISVAVTEEEFMEDASGDHVVPIVRRAALELAHIVRDQMDLYIQECEE